MAARGTFQKRQKEAARKDKRQEKLARRQSKGPGPDRAGLDIASDDSDIEPDETLEAMKAEIASGLPIRDV